MLSSLAKKKKEKKKKVPADIRKRIKKRHPNAKIKHMRQFMAVFEGAKDNGESDSRAYAKAWGVLNQNKELKDSHRKTDKEETKKKVKKWEKKHKWKDKKKKSSISYELTKLAGVLEMLGEADVSEKVHDMAKQMKEVFHTTNDPESKECKTPNSYFHIFVKDNEVGARVSLPFELELEEEEYQELEDEIHDALENILSKYFEDEEDEEDEKEDS